MSTSTNVTILTVAVNASTLAIASGTPGSHVTMSVLLRYVIGPR